MADPAGSPQRITAAERRSRIVAMRRLKLTFEDIGNANGVSRQRAHQIYVDALREIPSSELAEHRLEELEFADSAIRGLLPFARDRDRPRTAVDAWATIRTWCEYKARILGLFAPATARLEVVTDDLIEQEISRLETKLGVNDPSDYSGTA
jgi:hypothetical protein